MKRITFVCHGNICRSVAAEYIFKDIIRKLNKEDDFLIISRATSFEEIGNDIYPPMKRMLDSKGIKYNTHKASRFTKEDYENSDYVFYMDNSNLRGLLSIQEDKDNKYYPICHWTKDITYIEDPWYSSNYELVVNQIRKCILDILDNI